MGSRLKGRGDLTDEQWALQELTLRRCRMSGWPPASTCRQVTDGAPFQVRTAIPWRGMPGERYGATDRVCDLFRRRQ
ncbi:transposase [Streptomyces sp. NPDC002120]|uniref:transposase n=1 Tax=Streptomyces sp. NPDC002120 TaxID=3364631 RepID=UPI0036B722CF